MQELEEMRELFRMYDTDGSGELDEEEFVDVGGPPGAAGAWLV